MVKGILFPHSCQNVFIDLVVIATLTGVKTYVILVFICIPLVIGDVEYHSISLLDICMSSLEMCLFRSSAHLFIRLFCVCVKLYEIITHFIY